MKNKLSTKQGFTIIEVVLVLAIAGLIFLMVFVAFPALQRNQRDTQRRQDYADLAAAVISASTNNNGNFPTSATGLTSSIGKNGKDPSDKAYSISIATAVPDSLPSLSAGKIYIYQSSECNANGAPTKLASTNNKKFTIYGYLESGGYYCYSGQI